MQTGRALLLVPAAFACAGMVAACSGPGTTALPSNPNVSVQGRPHVFPVPPPTPSPPPTVGDTGVTVTVQNTSLGQISISAAGQLSQPTVSQSITVTNALSTQEAAFNIQYVVTSGNAYNGCGQSSTISGGTQLLAPKATKGFSVNIPVPNCPGTTMYTVTTNLIANTQTGSPGPLFASATAQFETSDLALKPDVVKGLQTLKAPFIADPGFESVNGSISFEFDGFTERLTGGLNNVPEGAAIGAFVRGQYFAPGLIFRTCPFDGSACTFSAQFGGGVNYFVGLNAPLPADPTGQLLGAGDPIEFFPVAGIEGTPGFNPVISQPVTITGPRIGTTTLAL